jgi:hypothetical protein
MLSTNEHQGIIDCLIGAAIIGAVVIGAFIL